MAPSDSRQFLRITTALLQCNPTDDASSIAQAAGVPEPTAHRILRFYRYHGGVRRGRGPLRADKRKVFQLAAGVRRAHSVPDLVLRDGPSEGDLIDALSKAGISFVLGCASAANRLAYFEPAPFTTLFVRRGDAAALKALVRRHKGTTEIHVRYDDPATLQTVGRGGVIVTDPFRTLLDVSADPGGEAHAEFLFDALLERAST